MTADGQSPAMAVTAIEARVSPHGLEARATAAREREATASALGPHGTIR